MCLHGEPKQGTCLFDQSRENVGTSFLQLYARPQVTVDVPRVQIWGLKINSSRQIPKYRIHY